MLFCLWLMVWGKLSGFMDATSLSAGWHAVPQFPRQSEGWGSGWGRGKTSEFLKNSEVGPGRGRAVCGTARGMMVRRNSINQMVRSKGERTLPIFLVVDFLADVPTGFDQVVEADTFFLQGVSNFIQ